MVKVRIGWVGLLLVGLLACGRLAAQSRPPLKEAVPAYTTQNKKAIRLYQQAQEQLRYRQIGKARTLLEEALEKDSTFLEAHRTLADMGRITADEDLVAKHFKSMALLRPEGPEAPSMLSLAARHARKRGRLDEAEALYTRALAYTQPLLPKLKRELERGLASVRFARQAVQNPLSITRKPLPAIVNRFPLQYTPAATADDQILIYTARKGIHNGFDEDMYITRRDAKGNWQTPEPLSSVINTEGNEGTNSISADGRTLVFAACDRPGTGSCDIYFSYRTGNTWSEPAAPDSINSADWDSNPNLSADGNTLFFVSARAGGYGRQDIYVSHRWPNGRWGRPANVGPAINTEENEMFPFLHPNGRTLFFGSEGHPGMGGTDLFMAEHAAQNRTDWTLWDAPRNLGYPLNTSQDESSIFISPDGTRAYYCVDDSRNGQLVRSLLYEFELGNSLQLSARSYFAKGTVRAQGTLKPLDAQIDLIDNTNGQVVYSVHSDPATGQYLMVLPEGSRYGLNVSATGYLFQSRFFNFADAQTTGSVEQDFLLEPLRQGAKTVLNNVFFASGSAELLPDSRAELTRLAALLKANPKVRVEVAGHTDDIGSPEANQALSQRRAQAVRTFLQQAGIVEPRLQAKGYGETRPAQANTTDEGRARNRRIEFVILSL